MDPRFRNIGFGANPLSKASFSAGSGTGYIIDTTLRLDAPISAEPSVSALKRKWSFVERSKDIQARPPLCLRLGRSSSSSGSKASSATGCTDMSSAKETDAESSNDPDLDFGLHLGSEKAPLKRKISSSNEVSIDPQPQVDLGLSLSCMPSESDVTTVHLGSNSETIPLTTGVGFQTGDRLNPFPLQAPTVTNLAPNGRVFSTPTSSVTCSSGITQQQQQRITSAKICQFEGCGKGARGASGLCIAHGGGRRCQKPGCHKGAEGRTAYCKSHGGGRRCEFLGCTKSAEGRTDYCIAHGGGRRCSCEGCPRAARGKSGLCIRHGGGKRCQMENCTKSAEGLSGLCISHGGGRRCQFPSCTKGAQGSTMFCKAHGGGKRCMFEGCTKGAEGSTPFCKGHGGGKRCAFQGGGVCPKSVHGGTLFCVAHGGGKRCAVAGCPRSARGRTDCCVRHGGGKRCKFEGCGKSAQGSTDFCKAHGGGKRCSWAEDICNSFARGKSGLCTSHGALVQDKRVHGGATLGTLVHDTLPTQRENVNQTIDARTNGLTSPVFTSSGSNQTGFGSNPFGIPAGLVASTGPGAVSEGRVHGGSLISLLAVGSGGSSESTTPTKWI